MSDRRRVKRGHNEGSIYQRGDGRWVATVSLKDSSGRTRRVSRYAKTRTAARDALRDMQRKSEDGIQLAQKASTLATFLEQWLASSVRASVRVKTYEGYESIVRVRIVPNIGGLKLTQVTPPIVQQLYVDLAEGGLAPRSIIHTHRCLHRAMEQALRWGMISRNPCDAVDPPRSQRSEITVLTQEQVTTLLAATESDYHRALYTLAVTTGMRQGELLGLKWGDIDLGSGRLQVRRTLQRQRAAGLVFESPKTAKSRRTIVLSKVAIEALQKHRLVQVEERLRLGPAWSDSDLVFPGPLGGPRDPGKVTYAFKQALEKNGLPKVRFHDLRHTAATLLLSQGMHPKVVSEMLGHATITITLDTYSHLVPVLHERAAAAMDHMFGS